MHGLRWNFPFQQSSSQVNISPTYSNEPQYLTYANSWESLLTCEVPSSWMAKYFRSFIEDITFSLRSLHRMKILCFTTNADKGTVLEIPYVHTWFLPTCNCRFDQLFAGIICVLISIKAACDARRQENLFLFRVDQCCHAFHDLFLSFYCSFQVSKYSRGLEDTWGWKFFRCIFQMILFYWLRTRHFQTNGGLRLHLYIISHFAKS